MTYPSALEFLNSLINYEKGFAKYTDSKYNPDLVGIMLSAAGLSDSKIKIIHIAGTKGKGSTSYYIARLLEFTRKAKVGLYTSPHLFRLNERIKINMKDIPDNAFAALVSEFQEIILKHHATYFESLTFIAMVYFIQAACDYVVLETGLGGKLDSTNYCRPVLTVITPIAYDHTAILGNSLAEIAGEKAGIIKPGIPLICAAQEPSALEVIRKVADSQASDLFYLPEKCNFSFISRSIQGSKIGFQMDAGGAVLNIQKLSIHQIGEASAVNYLLAALSCLVLKINPTQGQLNKAAKTKIPYRIEFRKNGIVDVSHNDSSLLNLFSCLKNYVRLKNFHLYIGVLSDKEISRIARVIEDNQTLFSAITVFDFKASRESGGKALFHELAHIPSIRYLTGPEQIRLVKKEFPVFTGSFYIAEQASQILKWK